MSKKKKVYLKDLPTDKNLRGVKVKTPTGTVGYWFGQWSKGVWLKKDMNLGELTPVFVEDLKQCLEWEVLNFDKI